MLLPVGSRESTAKVQEPFNRQSEETEDLQQRLSNLLSQMAGAGRVKVLLTEATGEQIFYQEDRDTSASDQSQITRTDTVIVTDGTHSQEGLIRQVNPPTYLGAVVLCQGADQPSVRLAITEAVANATGLGYHKITVLKMK